MSGERMYRQVLRRLMRDIIAEQLTIGSRLPTEKALSARYAVSRGTIGETLTALEVIGLVELSTGKGARLVRLPDPADWTDLRHSARQLVEARLLFEGEAAALAAVQATGSEIEAIHELALADHRDPRRSDRAFHLAIARATHNGAVFTTIERLWGHSLAVTELPRQRQPRHDHLAISLRLLERDAAAARRAMRRHIAEALGIKSGAGLADHPALLQSAS